MKYRIPASPQEVVNLRENTVNEELIAAAIVGVVKLAREKGQGLDELIAEVMNDDSLLERQQRRWLSEIVAQTWKYLP
jgi:hypothetical protein